MSQPSSPSNEKLCLLRRVLGIRLESDGRFEIPLRNTWKAFSRVEFFAIWIVLPYWAIMDDRTSSNPAHFGTYLVAAFALYLGLAAFLVVRREFSTHLYSGVGALAQRKQTHALSITGAVLGSTKNKRQPFLLLDGVQFPLATPIFASKEKRLAAVQVLREWTSPVEGTCSACPNGKAAFLSLLDVTSVEKDTVRFRAIWSKFAAFVFFACGFFALIFLGVFPRFVFSNSSFPLIFDLTLVFILLGSLGLAIFIQKSKPTVAITTGKCAEVVEDGERFTCPPWQSEFVVGLPNTVGDSGPVYPYIQLKYGNRYLTIHSSRMYAEDELEDFADRMNHFLWAGPTQPADPSATKIEIYTGWKIVPDDP